MNGSASRILDYMEGANKRYVIPVYQRKYEWKEENCRQLYSDLKKVIREQRGSHFFGSIVSSVVGNGAITEYHVIDGQQRLTTVTLLLLAMRNLINAGEIVPRDENLADQVNELYLFSKWSKVDDGIKLRPVKNDRQALSRLFGDEEDYDPSSMLTLNYRFFCSMLRKEEFFVDELYEAVGKLEIISITLESGDNAQLIFESLNSTGLDLTEGDKIRNYVLMGLPPAEQEQYYDKYWTKIEKCTADDVSGFVRDYLSVKRQVTPNIRRVYPEFKDFAEQEKEHGTIEEILADLLRYARIYEKFLTCKSGLRNQKLDDCLYRMSRLEIVVTRPFLLEVLRLNQDGALSVKEVLQIFLITETYLFRRNICEVPTNALNKIFLNLNKEILKYDGTAEGYVEKFIYSLLIRRESGRFPDDQEFAEALANKQVYQMRGKYKAYLFERFENWGTIETKAVYLHLDNNEYSIEHIMPQHLTPAWTAQLGEDAEKIHDTWLHRLGNLTLTGYNPNLSNKPFAEKRDAQVGGYKVSGLKMNQKIAMKESWGLPELKERSAEMTAQALQIWAMPQTAFVPAVRSYDSCTLDDENFELTGRDIVKYSYQNVEQPVSSWADMFEHVVQFLHQKDRSVLSALAYSTQEGLSNYVSSTSENFYRALHIDEHIYVQMNTSTVMKVSVLRRLFTLYQADPTDLVFYLRDPDAEKTAEADKQEIRRQYWTYALPQIQTAHAKRGSFSRVKPGNTNSLYGSFGISGFRVECIANPDHAIIRFYMGKADPQQNKAAFDILYQNKDRIEAAFGASLEWDRADQDKASRINYRLEDVNLLKEEDWPKIAAFHAEQSSRLCDILLPYLQEFSDSRDDEKARRLEEIAGILREWASLKEEVNVDPAKCVRSYTRFTTDAMSRILPDLKDAPSGWGTDNHYFYEIVNQTGSSVYIQFVISSKNITDAYRTVCDRINELYPARRRNWDWVWRNHFRTGTIPLGEKLSKNEIFAGLDQCYEEIRKFERELAQKLAAYDL